MSISTLDCKSDAPSYNYSPVYLSCWAQKNLPTSLKALIGPTYSNDPLANCPSFGYPTTQVEISMPLVKTPDCGGNSLVTWTGDAGGAQLSLFGIPFVTDYNNYIYTVGSSINVVGNCSYDPVTKITSLQVTGTLVSEGAGGFACFTPFIISYNGV